MNYRTLPPPASLAGYVCCYWLLEGDASQATPFVERIMADGMTSLVFHYDGVFDEVLTNGQSEKSIVSAFKGPSQQFRIFSIDRHFAIFGANLYPYAIPHLFSIPAVELKNQMLDLKTLLGKEENHLEEQIMMAKDMASRTGILSQFLESRLNKTKAIPPGIFETIRHIVKTNGSADVVSLAESNFLSLRQFQRNFKQYSGFNAKTFSRIIRFQKTLALQTTSNKTLTQIALEAGYTDQSHFNRDFREFSGFTPKEYFIKSRKE